MSLQCVTISCILLTLSIISNGEIPTPTRLIKGPEDVIVISGETITLDCIFDAPASNCYWEKDGEVLEIEGRYDFIGDLEEGNCSIKIQNTNVRDDGHWSCRYPKTMTVAGIKSNTVNVTIGVLPSDPVIAFDGTAVQKGRKIYLLSRNDVSKLSCWSENGTPPADLRWKLDNTTPLHGNSNEYPSRGNASLKIVKLVPNFRVQMSWQQQKLYCEAEHPSFEFPRTTYVQLLLRPGDF